MDTQQMRDQCIALEAVMLACRTTGRGDRGTTIGEIAREAIDKVDEWQARGDLEVLYYGHNYDPERSRDDRVGDRLAARDSMRSAG